MRVVPFLRVVDAEASAKWYARLGFRIAWRHRFAPDLPLFVAIAAPSDPDDRASIFLSEHAGDARPDTLVYVYVEDVAEIAREFAAEPADAPYGMREVELRDPDGNRLRFGAPISK